MENEGEDVHESEDSEHDEERMQLVYAAEHTSLKPGGSHSVSNAEDPV